MLCSLLTFLFSVVTAGQHILLPPRKLLFAASIIEGNTGTLPTRNLLVPSSALSDSLERLVSSKVSPSYSTPTTHLMKFVVQSSTSIMSKLMRLNPIVSPPNYLLKRSADLYSLRVPFGNEGYAELFLSNTTAVPFCQGVSTSLYEDSTEHFVDLSLSFRNGPATVPIQEDEAVAFCKRIRDHERVGGSVGRVTTPTDPTTTQSAKLKPLDTKDNDLAEFAIARPGEGSPNPTLGPTQPITTVTQLMQSAVPSEGGDGDRVADTKETVLLDWTPVSVTTGTLKPIVTKKPATELGNVPKSNDEAPLSRVANGDGLESSMPPTSLASGLQEETPNHSDDLGINKIPIVSRLALSTLTPTDPGAANDTVLVAEISHEGKFYESYTTISRCKATSAKDPPITTAPNIPETSMRVQDVGHQASVMMKVHSVVTRMNPSHEDLDEEAKTEYSNGAAISARAWQNAASRPRPFGAGLLSRRIMGIFTQLIHRSTSRKLAKQRPHTEESSSTFKHKSKNTQSSHLKAPNPTPTPKGSVEGDSAPATEGTSPITRPKASSKPTENVISSLSVFPDRETIPYSLVSASAARIPSHKFPKPTTSTPSKRPTPPKHTHKPSSPTAANNQAPDAVNGNATSPFDIQNETNNHAGTNTASSGLNHTFQEPEHGHLSSAFGGIEDHRILWTVVFVWVLVALQVVMSVWEFGRSAWGWKGKTYDRLFWKV